MVFPILCVTRRGGVALILMQLLLLYRMREKLLRVADGRCSALMCRESLQNSEINSIHLVSRDVKYLSP